jgi:hypothetical protein
MALKYTLYSWECIIAIIYARQTVPTLENSTTTKLAASEFL